MTSITDELRGFADDLDWHMWSNDDIARKLQAIADNIDAEHERRMEQAKREVRRKMARDMRWAVTMLEARESRRHIREGIEDGR